jgi:protein O-GlcNAc transferase
VLTCAGDTMASRVAGSQLHAIGLPELVTRSLAEYEALALALARDPQRLAQLKARLAANRYTHALFDMERFSRALDDLLIAAWENRRA